MRRLHFLVVDDDGNILLLILLKGDQVLAGLSELTFFRTARRAFPRFARSYAWTGFAARGWSSALPGLMCDLVNFYNRAAQKVADSGTSSRQLRGEVPTSRRSAMHAARNYRAGSSVLPRWRLGVAALVHRYRRAGASVCAYRHRNAAASALAVSSIWRIVAVALVHVGIVAMRLGTVALRLGIETAA
jgi:hypothetical protein